MTPSAEPHARTPALIGWRLAALLYDAFPLAAVWFVIAAVAVALHGGAAIHADTAAGWLEFAALWLVTAAYAMVSWRRGGQTIGMRAWRLHVVPVAGGTPKWRALALRFMAGVVSLFALGAGFAWAWIDRDGLTWHDRASGTRMVRKPKAG